MGLLGLFLMDTLLDKKKVFYHNVFTDGFAVFVGICALSVFWSANSVRSLDLVVSMSQMAVNNYLIYNLLRKYEIQTYLLWGFIFALTLNYLYGLGFIHLDVETNNSWRFEGTAGNSNEMGIYIFMGIVLCFLSIPRKLMRFPLFLVAFFPISIYFTVLTGSRKTLIVVVLFTVFYLFMNIFKILKPHVLLYIAIGILLISTQVDIQGVLNDDSVQRNIERMQTLNTVAESGFEDSSVRDRRILIEYGIENIPNKPILGYGVGTFIDVNPLNFYSHNNYIEVLFGVGILGFMACYFGPFAILLRAIRKHSFDIALVILIIFLLDFSVVSYNLKPHMVFYLYLASLLDLKRDVIV